MSNPGTPTSILPSITGNQGIDRLIRSALLAIAAGVTGVIVTWLNSHGFHDPNLSLMVSGAVVSTLTAILIVVWGWINGKKTEVAAKQAVTEGVKAGIAIAQDQTVSTPPPASIGPALATEIVANYAPATKAQ